MLFGHSQQCNKNLSVVIEARGCWCDVDSAFPTFEQLVGCTKQHCTKQQWMNECIKSWIEILSRICWLSNTWMTASRIGRHAPVVTASKEEYYHNIWARKQWWRSCPPLRFLQMLPPFPFLNPNKYVRASKIITQPIIEKISINPLILLAIIQTVDVIVLKSAGRSTKSTEMRYLYRPIILRTYIHIIWFDRRNTLSNFDTKSPTRCLHTIPSRRLSPSSPPQTRQYVAAEREGGMKVEATKRFWSLSWGTQNHKVQTWERKEKERNWLLTNCFVLRVFVDSPDFVVRPNVYILALNPSQTRTLGEI